MARSAGRVLSICLIVIVFLAATVLPSFAAGPPRGGGAPPPGGGRPPGGGGAPPGGPGGGGFRPGAPPAGGGGRPPGGSHPGGGGSHGSWHGGRWPGSYGGWWGSSVIIGGYPYWWNPYPYYYPYPYAYPLSPPLVDPEPPVYIEQAPAQYWYYCRDPQGYYPYVSQCPGGWLPVAPLPPAPPGEGR